MISLLLVGVMSLSGAAPRSMPEATAAYARAYDSAFKALGTVGLADTQSRLQKLGKAGKSLQPELEDLSRRQHEVNDLIVKAVESKKQALADGKPAAVDEAAKVLGDAEGKAQRLHADLVKFNEKLTAAGAPQLAPEPPRDPNARD